jgi:hypothetical protein
MVKYDGLEANAPNRQIVWWGACGVLQDDLTWASLFSAILSDVAM